MPLPIAFLKHLSEASRCDEFIAHRVQSDDRWTFRIVWKMTTNSVPNVLAQFVHVLALGKDGFAKATGHEAAFGIFLDDENNL